jgi:hypothetical protein
MPVIGATMVSTDDHQAWWSASMAKQAASGAITAAAGRPVVCTRPSNTRSYTYIYIYIDRWIDIHACIYT